MKAHLQIFLKFVQLTNEQAKICQISKKLFMTEIIREGINLILPVLAFYPLCEEMPDFHGEVIIIELVYLL